MKNRDLKLSLEVLVMSLPVLLRALQPMLQSTPWPTTQTTGESDPSRGQLKAQGSPTRGLPMLTYYPSHKSGPIRG